MTAIKPTIKLFTSDKDNAGIQINSFILEHQGNNYHLQGGTKDTIHVFLQGLGIYVLTINNRLGYIGLNSFMAPEPDPINSMYLHNYEDITETLGKKWEQLSPIAITMKLINYLM
jgi:hypothetical protein